MDLHSKIISEKELEFFKLAEKHGIAPNILDIRKDGEYYEIFTQKYPQQLLLIPLGERYKLSNDIKILINKLHQIGIYHGDLHEDNIIYDPNDGIRIVDFGLSKWICDLNDNDLNNHMYMIDEEKDKANSVEHLLEMEINECDFICGVKH